MDNWKLGGKVLVVFALVTATSLRVALFFTSARILSGPGPL